MEAPGEVRPDKILMAVADEVETNGDIWRLKVSK